jgi:hypothetical protein
MCRWNYRVKWSAEDSEYVATCDEFPSLSCLSVRPNRALAELEDLVQDVVVDMLRTGEALPVGGPS